MLEISIGITNHNEYILRTKSKNCESNIKHFETYSYYKIIHSQYFPMIFQYVATIVQKEFSKNMWISVFRGSVSWNFFRFTLKAFISIRMTLGTILNDYFDYLRHVWDIFGTIRPLKIIFWDYIFENFRLKMNKNTFFGVLCLYKVTKNVFLSIFRRKFSKM